MLGKKQAELFRRGSHIQGADPGVGVPGAVEGSLPADKRGQAAQGIHQPVRKQVGS